MDPLGAPYDDVDALFFEKENVYNLFENDNDLVVHLKKKTWVVEHLYMLP